MEWYWWLLIGIAVAWFWIAGLVGSIGEGPSEYDGPQGPP